MMVRDVPGARLGEQPRVEMPTEPGGIGSIKKQHERGAPIAEIRSGGVCGCSRQRVAR